MAVTVVLADGFDGQTVQVSAGGRTETLGPARTSLLTGMAAELVLEDGSGPVAVRLADDDGSPWTGYQPAPGDVVVLDLVDGSLTGRVLPGPVGFG